MKGNPAVIDALHGLLTVEYNSAQCLFVAARDQRAAGFPKLCKRLMREYREEFHHAENLLDHLLFLGDDPDDSPELRVESPGVAPEVFRYLLGQELSSLNQYEAALTLAQEQGDALTQHLLCWIIAEEKDDIVWLETQLKQIQAVGLTDYMGQWI